MKVSIEITSCKDCPFAKYHTGQGECWTYCSNRDSKRGPYETILWGCHEHFTKIPLWCPLGIK